MLSADYVFWPAVALVVMASLYYGPRITSERMAMQWGLDGKPTWHAPKAVGLWAMVVFALAVRLFIWAAMTYAPDRVRGPEIAVLLLSFIMVAVHLFMLRAAMRAGNYATDNMNRRQNWRKVLAREVQRWSALPCDRLLSELPEVKAYEVEHESKTYQVEVEILENTTTYVHVLVGVDDGSLPASIRPETESFLCRKPPSDPS